MCVPPPVCLLARVHPTHKCNSCHHHHKNHRSPRLWGPLSPALTWLRARVALKISPRLHDSRDATPAQSSHDLLQSGTFRTVSTWGGLTNPVHDQGSALRRVHQTSFVSHHARMPPNAEWSQVLFGLSTCSTPFSAMPVGWSPLKPPCQYKSTTCNLEGNNYT
jgi:hypothetical protein